MTKANEKSSLKWWDAVIPLAFFLIFQNALMILALLFALVIMPENLLSNLLNGSFSADKLFLASRGVLGWAVFISSIVSLIFSFLYLKFRKINLQAIGFKGFRISSLLLIVTASVGLILVASFYDVVMKNLSVDTDIQIKTLFSLFGYSRTGLVLLVLTGVFLGPAVEEIVFRGFFYKYMDEKLGFLWAAFISAMVFSLAHFIIFGIPILFLIGFVLAYIMKKTKSLWPAILTHIFYNGTLATVVYFSVSNGKL